MSNPKQWSIYYLQEKLNLQLAYWQLQRRREGGLTLQTLAASGRGGNQSWRMAPTRPRRDPHLQSG